MSNYKSFQTLPKDLRKYILPRYLSDNDVLSYCSINKEYIDFGDEQFFQTLLESRYPSILKSEDHQSRYDKRREYMSHKKYYLLIIRHINLLKNKYQFHYRHVGSPTLQYKVFESLSKKLGQSGKPLKLTVADLIIGETLNKLLKTASSYGCRSLIDYALDNGADIHHADDNALLLALTNNHFQTAKYLIEKGANVRALGDRPLMIACKVGNLEAVEYLFQKGANIYAIQNQMLYISCINGQLHIAAYLIEKGVNIDSNESWCLRAAITKGHLHIVKYLIELGAKVNIITKEFLKEVKDKGYIEMVEYLQPFVWV
jgi:ankyrin repeat protein